jgi:Glucodextranase, domain B
MRCSRGMVCNCGAVILDTGAIVRLPGHGRPGSLPEGMTPVRASKLTVVLASVLAGAGFAAPAASAVAFTTSTITAPADGTQLFYDVDSRSGSVTVSGTVSGAVTGSLGNLLCYDARDSEEIQLVGAVDVSSGHFSLNVSLGAGPAGNTLPGKACRLRLVPADVSTPSGIGTAPYSGPAIAVAERASHSSTGNQTGYYILAGSLSAAYALQSLGECPVTASYATDPGTLTSFKLFTGNACLPYRSGIAPGLNSRSALEVDGLNAYPPGAIGGGSGRPDLTATPGFAPLTYTSIFNPSHDAVTISETDLPVICAPPGVFPPTAAGCPFLIPAGVQVQQTTALQDGGQVARVDQTITNTDARFHTVDELFSQSILAPAAGQVPGFEFPTQMMVAAHAQPDEFTGFPGGPGSIIAVGDAGGPPSPTNPVGAITYSSPPTAAAFTSAGGSQTASFVMHYVDTLPPGASATHGWSFIQANSAAALSALEPLERDRFLTPTVAISRPRRGTRTRQPRILVSGIATDPVGLRSLTLNGRAIPPSGGTGFATTVILQLGRNTLQATATNLAGRSTTASVTVTFVLPPCRVPQLQGLTLRAARSALVRHHCRVGRIRRARSLLVSRGRVVSSRPPAGTKRKWRWRVGLVVSRGA